MKLFTTNVLLISSFGLMAQTPAPKQTPPPPKVIMPVVKPATTAPTAPMATVPPADPNKVILTIGNEKMTVAQYDKLVAALPDQAQTAAHGPARRQFVEQLVQLKVLSQEAQKRKLDQTPKVQEQMELSKENLLAQVLYQDLMSTATVSDAEARKYYDEHKSEYEEAKGRHILIRSKGSAVPLGAGKKELTEEEALVKAQEVRKKLLAGEDFGMLAKAESDDTGSGAQGGDLGTFKRGNMVKPFDDAAFSIPVGQVSEPVKSPFGYHVIKIESREAKSFEQAKPEIDKKLKPQAAKQEMDALRKNASVTIDDSFFGAPGSEK